MRHLTAGLSLVLMACALARADPSPAAPHFTFTPARRPAVARTYPWHRDITTSVFWMDPHQTRTMASPGWTTAANPRDTSRNPFYVALPFDDVAHPDLAQSWLPSGWMRSARKIGPLSACRHHWIEMKDAGGKTCFAQWEDVGPLRTDDAAYVFGCQKPQGAPSLDVSPAVAKYLNILRSEKICWRFIDDDDVPPGRWLQYNKQEVLFSTGKDPVANPDQLQRARGAMGR